MSRRALRHWLTAAACAAVLAIAPPGAAAQEYAIVDADMGVLNDDAVALFMLLNSANVQVLGVSIVPGNSWMEHGTAAALRQLELIGRTDIPVFMGVREPLMGSRQPWLEAEERLWGRSEYLGAYGRPRPESYLALDREPAIGYPTSKPSAEHAVDFIVRAIKAHPNQVTVFALGPATNLALAIRKNPEIVPLVKRVYYMGGAIDVPGNTTPAAEFNWWFDPESVRITLRAPFREQIIVPIDIAERVFYTKAEYDRIVGAPETPITALFRKLHGPRFEKDAAARSFVWDALTTAIFLQPAIATKLDDRYVDIDVTYGPNYGRSIGYHAVAAPVARHAGRLPGRNPEGEGAHGRRPQGVLGPLRRSDDAAPMITRTHAKGVVMSALSRATLVAALVAALAAGVDRAGGRPGAGRQEEGVHRPGRRRARHRHDLDAGDAAVAGRRGARHHRDRRRRLGQGRHRPHAADAGADRPRQDPGGRRRRLPADQLARPGHGLGGAVWRVLLQGRLEPRPLPPARPGADAADRRDHPEADRPARRAVHDPADPQVPRRGDAVGRRAVHDRGAGAGARSRRSPRWPRNWC